METEHRPLYSGEAYDSQRSVGYWIKHAFQSMQRSLEIRMQDLDLTGYQWGPLWLIWRGSADTVAGCAREAGIDAGAMTRMLDRLEAKGLVVRERSTQDRRVVHVSLTPHGAEISARIPHIVADVLNQHTSGFSAAEAEQLVDLLRRFVHNAGHAGLCHMVMPLCPQSQQDDQGDSRA